MPADLVPIFEDEFYRFYINDVCYLPLKSNLYFKNNYLDEELVSFVI